MHVYGSAWKSDVHSTADQLSDSLVHDVDAVVSVPFSGIVWSG